MFGFIFYIVMVFLTGFCARVCQVRMYKTTRFNDDRVMALIGISILWPITVISLIFMGIFMAFNSLAEKAANL